MSVKPKSSISFSSFIAVLNCLQIVREDVFHGIYIGTYCTGYYLFDDVLVFLQVNMTMIGKSNKDRDKSVGEIISEINIIRDQLKHPNIVKYYRTFTVGKAAILVV